MRRIYRNALILLAVLAVGGSILFGLRIGLSVLLGGGLAVLNFHWLTAGVDRALRPGARPAGAGPIVKYLARLVLILLAFSAIIHSSFLDVLGALVGLSVFVLSGMLEAVILLLGAQNKASH